MPKKPPLHESSLFTAEVAPGLEDIAAAEMTRLRNIDIISAIADSGEVEFVYTGKAGDLLPLKTVIAVYSVRRYDVPRPKALLGHQHFQTLIRQIQQSLHLHPADTFKTLYISAAGSESSVMQRLKEELSTQTGLKTERYEGDLWIRLRRGQGGQGWETLVRLSPRPLATRAWRVQDMPGALNASIAHAMVSMTLPKPTDTCLNIACGSGTILIERASYSTAGQVIGCDISSEILTLAEANITAAGYSERIRLVQADAGKLPLADNSISAFYSDLPFGSLMGSHAENQVLYPALLREAARVAQPGAHFAVITHELKLMDNVLRQIPAWTVKHVRKVILGGLHPRIFLLVRG